MPLYQSTRLLTDEVDAEQAGNNLTTTLRYRAAGGGISLIEDNEDQAFTGSLTGSGWHANALLV